MPGDNEQKQGIKAVGVFPNSEIRFMCLMHSKPISKSPGLKQRKFYNHKGSSIRRKGGIPKPVFLTEVITRFFNKCKG